MAAAKQSPTDLLNEWLISDPIRIKAWRKIADSCLQTAHAMQADGHSGKVATWLLATQLRARYETAPGEAGLLGVAEVDWEAIATAFILGLSQV